MLIKSKPSVRKQGFDLDLTRHAEICNTYSHLTLITHHAAFTKSAQIRAVSPVLFLPFNSFLSSCFFPNLSSTLAYSTLNELRALMKWERKLQETGTGLKMLFQLHSFSLSRTEWNIPMAMYSLICINFFSYMVTADAL